MSVGALTSIGVARNLRAPTKSDAGERTEDSNEADQAASIPELLVKQVPTSLVAGYTAVTATLVALIPEPTSTVPNPDELLNLRWIAFFVLVLSSALLTGVVYYAKAGRGARKPVLEVLGVTISAAGWGLVVPESPILAMVDDVARSVGTVAVVGFVAISLNTVTAAGLSRKAKTSGNSETETVADKDASDSPETAARQV